MKPTSFTAADRKLAKDIAKKVVTASSKSNFLAMVHISHQHPHPKFPQFVSVMIDVLMCDKSWMKHARN